MNQASTADGGHTPGQSAQTPSLASLIERLEKATGPDRETDLAIQLTIEPNGNIAELMRFPRGFDGKPGMAWDIHHGGSVCFEKRDDYGRCSYSGGYPLPRYTSSIDAAMTLVPKGWHTQISTGRPGAYAHICRDPNDDYAPFFFSYERPQRQRGKTPPAVKGAANPAIALCIAALKAHSVRDPSDSTKERALLLSKSPDEGGEM